VLSPLCWCWSRSKAQHDASADAEGLNTRDRRDEMMEKGQIAVCPVPLGQVEAAFDSIEEKALDASCHLCSLLSLGKQPAYFKRLLVGCNPNSFMDQRDAAWSQKHGYDLVSDIYSRD
jgi:TRAP-type mannitol/chloroaromatic compound transport system substrate-binding protein